MINDVLKKPPTFLDTLDKLAKEKEQRDNLFKVAPTPALQRIEQTKKDLRAGKKATPNNAPQKTTIRTKYGVFEVEVPKSSLKQEIFSNVENRNKYILTPELYAEIRKEIEDAQEKAGVAKTRPDLPDIEANPPEVDITAETLKNLKAWEDKYIRSTAVGRSYQDTLKWVQNEAEQYSNRADSPVAKLAGALVSGMAEDAANPLATFESAVGNMYDPNATFEERFGAIGNAALYGLSVAPFVKAGSAGVRAIKATQMAEQAIARGLKIKAGLVAFGRTYGRETLLGGFAERRVTISQLRKTLEEKGFTAKEIDDVISSQRKLYKIWSKTNKGDFNDFLLQAVRNETKSAEKAGENVANAIGTGADVTDAVDNIDAPRMDAQPAKAPDVQEPDIPGYNVPEEQLQNIPSARGTANFENLWNMAKESGTLNDKQIYVGKALWMARAKAWAKENNRNEMDFFENLIVTKDDVMPDSALMQSVKKSIDEVGEVDTRVIKSTSEKTLKQFPVDRSRLLLSNLQDINVDPKYASRLFQATKKSSPIFRDAKNIDDIVSIIKDNLHELMDIANPVTKEFGKLWYDGANRIATQWADRYGYSRSQVAGVLAVNSPQTEWFTNVSRAERILDMVKNKSDLPFDNDMFKFGKTKMTLDKDTGKMKRQFSDKLLELVKGKSYNELTDLDEKAAWLIIYDSVYNPKKYRIITPDGRVGDWARNKNGKETAFKSFTTSDVKKSIRMLEDGSVESISGSLGDAHKVRNFYNNIIDPNSSLGHYTADTHQGAASVFKPIGGSSPEVLKLLGGTSSAPLGYTGAYPIYHQAGIITAKELGILPRELQSITWETVRSLFSNKSKPLQAKVESIWNEFLNGKITKRDAWNQIEDIAGGTNTPNWVGDLKDAKYGKQTFNDVEFPDEFNKFDSMIELPNKDILLQNNDNITKGWYNEANRQINFMTGLSDFSTFVHESFHDWATMLKQEHVDALVNVFGDMTTVEGKEAAARAFERYLRDGVAPTTELERVFVSIKGWMKAVYNKLKGSPIEAKVDPRARRVFDEMLGSTAYGDEGVTSARKAFTDADRKAMGLKATKEIDPESFQQWLDDSDQMVTDSGMSLNGWGNATADRILANPTALSDVETAGMVKHMQDLKNQHSALNAKLSATTDQAEVKAIGESLKRIEEQFDNATLAVKLSGTEKGRSLNAQKITINQDFDLLSVENRYRTRSFDGQIPDNVKKRLRELTDKIKEQESKIVDLEDQMLRGNARRTVRSDAEIVQARKNIADKLKEAFTQNTSQAQMAVIPIPQGVSGNAKLLVDYALTFVEQGRGKIEDVVNLAHKSLNDVGVPVSKDEIKGALQAWVSSKKFKNNDLVDYLQELKTGLRNTPEVAIRPLLDSNIASSQEIAHYVMSFAEQTSGRVGEIVDMALDNINQRTSYPYSREDLLDAVREWGLPRVVTREMDMRQYQLDRLKREVRKEIALGEKTKFERVRDAALNTPRALKATLDMSATLRQGLLLGLGNPTKATAAFAKAFKATFSPAYAAKLDRELHMSKMAPIRKQAGLFISEGALSPEEIQFMQNMGSNIPGIKNLLDGSERHYTTFLNQLRVSVFDDMVSKFPDMTSDERKALADFVNVSTGRGRMTDNTIMSSVLFSPRFFMSRLQAPADFIGGFLGVSKPGRAMWKSPAARKQMLQSWSIYLGTMATVAGLARMNGAKVQIDDPNDADWGKIVYGDTRIDMYGGFQQPVRLLARMAMGGSRLAKDVTSGRGISIDAPKDRRGFYDMVNQFVDFKLSPNAQLILGIGGEDATGQPMYRDKTGKATYATVTQDFAKGAGVPLSVLEIRNLWQGKGIDTMGKALLTGGIILGLGSQTYDKTKGKEKSSGDKNPYDTSEKKDPYESVYEKMMTQGRLG